MMPHLIEHLHEQLNSNLENRHERDLPALHLLFEQIDSQSNEELLELVLELETHSQVNLPSVPSMSQILEKD